MAETKSQTREYVIPLRAVWLKAPRHDRARKAVKAIKIFVAKHMKVADRDLSKVKLDVYFNNDIWFRGRKKPPAKVKVKVVRDGENVKVDFVEVPEHVSFLKKKHDKFHKKIEKEKPKVEPKEEPKDEKSESVEDKSEKKSESEKEQSVAELREKQASNAAKEQKHTQKIKDKKQPQQRKVLSRH